ncbi:MAG: YdcF family protein [Rhodospirillaceae bacterium]
MSPKAASPFVVLRRALLLFGALALCWLAGLAWFITSLPDGPPTDTLRTDAIVVLTGGRDRLPEGLELLAQNKADLLFVSGVGEDVTLGDLERVTGPLPGNLAHRVVLGHAALNTAGNAQETARWVAENNIASIRLVTTAFHMPRSLAEFRAALPAVTVTPHPVFPEEIRHADWWRRPGTAYLLAQEFTKYLLVQARLVLSPAVEAAA